MKKFRELSEQHREKGRFKPTVPHNVSSTPGGTPRETSDSANVRLREAIKDKYDIGEYDQEGDMAKSDLRSIIANSKRVHDMLEDDDNLPEWVQAKITKAEDYMSTVANYMEAEMNEAVKMPKQTGAEKEYRRITGKTVDQRISELDKIQKNLAKQKEDYIKQGIIKAESVEQIDELKVSTLTRYGTKATQSYGRNPEKDEKRLQGIQRARAKVQQKTMKKEETEVDESIASTVGGLVGQYAGSKIGMEGPGKEHGALAGRMIDYHARKFLKKVKNKITGQKNESVELDEGKYGGFRVGPKRPKYPYVPQGNSDPRTGLPLGFSNPPKSEKPEDKKMKKEEVELLDEKNKPTNPELWGRAKALARQKFDVYPSAYANGWAAKWYKSKGGGWRSVSEDVEELDENLMKKLAAAGIAATMAASPVAHARVTPGGQSVAQQAVSTQKAPEEKKASVPSKSYLQNVASGKSRSIMHPDTAKELLKKHYSEDVDLEEGYFKNQEIERQETERLAKMKEPPFKADKSKKPSVVVGKKPEGYSRARQLARRAIPKPVKEAKEMSRKAKIVKNAMKKNDSEDTFQAKPELGDSVTRNL